MANNNTFTVYIYENEQKYLKWLVLQKQNIETGGDLFGVWQNEQCAVVQFVLGPGKGCRRTTTSFFQDVNYLGNVGRYLTSNEGICNIGEWHSHHRIGLAYPSDGDQNTVWSNMGEISGGRFLVFIANIENVKVKIGCFMFNSATRKMTQGKMKTLANCSPIRHTFKQEMQLKLEAEPGQDWDTFYMSKSREVGQRRCGGNQIRDFDQEYGETRCVCEITDEIGCCACLKRAVSCVCCFFRAIYRCGSCAWTLCLTGLIHLHRKCCGNGRPARD
jgi:hypothetical protein